MDGLQVTAPTKAPAARARRGALLAGALALSACAEDPALEGSVGELLDLRYQQAQAQLSPDELSVRFLTTQGTGENTILKVTARMKDLTYVSGSPIDLAEQLVDGTQRGSLDRSVLDEPVRPFPALARGSLRLSGTLEPGGSARGDFHVTFVNGTDVYSGRTVFGHFEATVP